MLAMNFLQLSLNTQIETSDSRNVKAFALKLKHFFQYLISFVGKLPAVNSKFRKSYSSQLTGNSNKTALENQTASTLQSNTYSRYPTARSLLQMFLRKSRRTK